MIKGIKDIFILMLAIVCLLVSLILLPWSELNFTANFPDWLASAMDYMGVTKLFTALSHHDKLMEIVKFDRVTENIGDYAYALFLFVAMTAAALAIISIGKEENTEKTVLEVKK